MENSPSVVGVFDTTVWAVRDEVRNMLVKMLWMPPDRKQSPHSIIRHHGGHLKARPDRKSARVVKTVNARLQFTEYVLHSWRSRSDSNLQRLLKRYDWQFILFPNTNSKI